GIRAFHVTGVQRVLFRSTADPLELDNVPALRDIGTTLTLLQRMGVRAERKGETHVILQADQVSSQEAPYELVKTMRASILVLGRSEERRVGTECRARWGT